MRSRELIGYSRRLLKGRRTGTTAVCLLPAAAEICFRSAEAAVYCLLIYFGEVRPAELFSGRNIVQISVCAACAVLRFTAVSPLRYAAAYRLSELTREDVGRYTPLSRILMNRRDICRSYAASFWIRTVSFAAMIPAVLSGMLAYDMLMKGGGTERFFMTLNSIALTAAFLLLWIYVRLTLAAVPFIMARIPGIGAAGAVIYSFRLMHGRKNMLPVLAAVYAVPALTAVLLPAAVTEMMTAFSLSLSIYQKEDEYAGRNEYHRRYGSSRHAAKLSYRKKRRFTAAADETETA